MTSIQTWSRLLSTRKSRPSAASLTWDQVRLPPSVTEADLDGIIFSLLQPQMAKDRDGGHSSQRSAARSLPCRSAMKTIAARLQVLSDSDRIEGIGDLRYWRHSEARFLKDLGWRRCPPQLPSQQTDHEPAADDEQR